MLQYSLENTCVGVSFLTRMQTFSPVTLLKTDSNTGVLDDDALYYTLDAQIWAEFSHLKRHCYMLSSL